MTLPSAIALFSTMVILALLPSLSVMTVVARSVAFGFRHGAATSLGIAASDILYILLAIYGLTLLAEKMAGLLLLIKYAGAAYLIWLGLLLWRSKSSSREVEATTRNATQESSLLSSFLAGFLLTLADQKAILFYLSFFPAFIDLSQLSLTDTGWIIAIALTAVGGVKLGYALLADQARQYLPNANASRGVNLAAGTVMMGAGVAVLLKG